MSRTLLRASILRAFFTAFACLSLVSLDPATARAHDFKLGALTIDHPWSRATPGGARVAGGFMKITNTGKEADRLVGGSSDVSGVFEVHEMKMEGNVMKMRALEKGLEIAPGATVELKPGSYHVMFIDLKRSLKTGDKIKGELVFEKAGRVAIEYNVEAMTKRSAGGSSHDAHGSHGSHGGMKK